MFGNEWSFMPNMTKRRSAPNMVVVRDKLFVIGFGTNSCEVYDKTSKKFVILKSNEFHAHQVVSIGEKIYVFGSNFSMDCYNVNKNKWSDASCEATNMFGFSCVKLLSW